MGKIYVPPQHPVALSQREPVLRYPFWQPNVITAPNPALGPHAIFQIGSNAFDSESRTEHSGFGYERGQYGEFARCRAAYGEALSSADIYQVGNSALANSIFGTTPTTFVIVYALRATANNCFLIGSGQPQSSALRFAFINYPSGNFAIRKMDGTWTTLSQSGLGSAAAGDLMVAVVTWDGSGSLDFFTTKGESLDVTDLSSGDFPSSNTAIQVGASYQSGANSNLYSEDVDIFLTAFYPRNLGRGVARQIIRDPYGVLLKPANQTPFLYSVPDAGGPAATVTRFHTDDISRGAALGAASSLDGALVT